MIQKSPLPMISPHRKALLARLNGSALLDIAPTSDALAGLRIVEHGVVAVDVMFGVEIVSVGGSPMPLERCPYFAISHLHLPFALPATRSMRPAYAGPGSPVKSSLRLCWGPAQLPMATGARCLGATEFFSWHVAPAGR